DGQGPSEVVLRVGELTQLAQTVGEGERTPRLTPPVSDLVEDAEGPAAERGSLRVLLAATGGGAHPRYARNPGTGEAPADATTFTPVRITLYADSALTLPHGTVRT